MLGAGLLLTGCVVGSRDEPSAEPRRDLAATPQSLPPTAEPTARASGAASSAPSSVRPGTSGSAPASGPAPTSGVRTTAPGSTTSAPPAAPFHGVGTRNDRSGDAGRSTPGYGDLTSITIEDDGQNARVTMHFAGAVPTRLPANETMGVGVDFYRNALQTESEYQLFADGQPEGWYAYLHTPGGFVRYRGTFGIGGNRIVFTVPWSAIGSPSRGDFSAFADWTRSVTGGSNLAGEDFVPDIGHATYAR